MSDEAKLRAQLQRADQRIAELEAELKTARSQAQIFASAIIDGAIHAGLLTKEQTNVLDGVQLLKLFDDIINLCTERTK